MTTPFERVREVFLAAADLAPEERHRYLDEECADEPAVREQVEALLPHDDRPVEGLQTSDSPVPNAVAGLLVQGTLPERIGPYAIRKVLGVGGMGIVYLAEQASPRRSVALKVVRHGLMSPQLFKRFEREAEVLGRLHHPGIATIYEAGTFEDLGGRLPFFAMEYVEGAALTEFAAEQELGRESRLELLISVCDAVHHAHQQGVIHRDLKPDNVLVDASGQVKILDFGIAQPTDLEEKRLTVETGAIIGTLEYMSPEQVSGRRADVTTVSDVYSLGTILFELLAGRLPHDFRDQPITVAAHTITHSDLPRLGSIDRELRGDLETIVARAAEKEPARRYQSAAELAADLRRHLASEPIHARHASTLYQVRKFARRHRAWVAGGVFALLALVVGSVVAIYYGLQSVEDLERFQQSESERRRELALSLKTTTAGSVPLILETLAGDRDDVLPLLRAEFFDEQVPGDQRLRLACALTVLGEPEGPFIVDAIPTAGAMECGNIAAACRHLEAHWWDEMEARTEEGELASRIRYAVVLLDLGRDHAARELLALGADLGERSEFIHAFKSWHGELELLPERIRAERDPEFQSGLCAAVGGIEGSTIPSGRRQDFERVFADLHVTSPSALVHSTTLWALRRWGHEPPEVPLCREPLEDLPAHHEWVRTDGGFSAHPMTMIRVPAGVGVIGPGLQLVHFSQDLWMADRETTSGMMREYLDDPDYLGRRDRDREFGVWDDETPAGLAWVDAVLFCNWLSRRSGLGPCYVTDGPVGTWRLDLDASGYRLPTSAEYEYALRGGTETKWICGDSPRRLTDYADLVSRPKSATRQTRARPAGGNLPSPTGFFDLIGGRWEYCTDLATGSPADGAVDPIGQFGGSMVTQRGAGVGEGDYYCESEISVPGVPIFGKTFRGFRVVRRIVTAREAPLTLHVDAPPRMCADGSMDGPVALRLTNTGDEPVEFTARWIARGGFTAQNAKQSGRVAPGGKAGIRFQIAREAGSVHAGLTTHPWVVVTARGAASILQPVRPRVEQRSLPEGRARARPMNKVLVLDGKSAVGVDFGQELHSLERLTLECWVRGEAPRARACLLGNCQSSGFGIFSSEPSFAGDRTVGLLQLSGGYVSAPMPAAWGERGWTHLALCYDGSTLSLFVDGQRARRTEAEGSVVPSPLPFYVGADTSPASAASFFTGAIDEVRLSRIDRYHDSFTPERFHVADEDTLLLLHFDAESEGFHLDASGHGHHGWPVGRPKLAPEAR